VTAHGEEWFTDLIAVTVDINGPIPPCAWGAKDVFDEVYHEGSHCNSNLSQFDVFKLRLPSAQINFILRESNNIISIRNTGTPAMSRQELYKLLGMLILMTRFDFTSQNSLWSKFRQYHLSSLLSLADSRRDIGSTY
jgi:hypothetical protein